MRQVPEWHEFFLQIIDVCKKRSKDESSQVGSVIVGSGREIVATGYNSFPRGVDDSKSERQQRPEKYYWFEHAERNAIYNAARVGVSLKDCIIYIPALPCMDCARAIVQVGIKTVIIDEDENNRWSKRPTWDEHMKRTLELFNEAGVVVHKYKRKK